MKHQKIPMRCPLIGEQLLFSYDTVCVYKSNSILKVQKSIWYEYDSDSTCTLPENS